MGNILVSRMCDGSTGFRFSGESAGLYVRREEHAYGTTETLPDTVSLDSSLLTGEPAKRELTQSEKFYLARLHEYKLCKRYYDSRYKMLAIFVKRDNARKAMVAITVKQGCKTVWFTVSGSKLVPYKVFDGTVSQATMRATLQAGKDLKVYAQSVKEVIRTFEHKHSDYARAHGTQAAKPRDRKPQTFTLKGKPMRDIDSCTRQDSDLHARPNDMVARSRMLRFAN